MTNLVIKDSILLEAAKATSLSHFIFSNLRLFMFRDELLLNNRSNVANSF